MMLSTLLDDFLENVHSTLIMIVVALTTMNTAHSPRQTTTIVDMTTTLQIRTKTALTPTEALPKQKQSKHFPWRCDPGSRPHFSSLCRPQSPRHECLPLPAELFFVSGPGGEASSLPNHSRRRYDIARDQPRTIVIKTATPTHAHSAIRTRDQAILSYRSSSA